MSETVTLTERQLELIWRVAQIELPDFWSFSGVTLDESPRIIFNWVQTLRNARIRLMVSHVSIEQIPDLGLLVCDIQIRLESWIVRFEEEE